MQAVPTRKHGERSTSSAQGPLNSCDQGAELFWYQPSAYARTWMFFSLRPELWLWLAK